MYYVELLVPVASSLPPSTSERRSVPSCPQPLGSASTPLASRPCPCSPALPAPCLLALTYFYTCTRSTGCAMDTRVLTLLPPGGWF